MDSKIEVSRELAVVLADEHAPFQHLMAAKARLRDLLATPVVGRHPGEAIRAMTPKDWELIAANATCSQQATLISMQNTELAKLRQLTDRVGYRLVPLTPTPAMVEAGMSTLCGDDEHQDYRDVYAAMIGAAP